MRKIKRKRERERKRKRERERERDVPLVELLSIRTPFNITACSLDTSGSTTRTSQFFDRPRLVLCSDKIYSRALFPPRGFNRLNVYVTMF